jgi:hypothetical protein
MIFFAGLQAGGLQKTPESDLVRDLKLLCRDQLVCVVISALMTFSLRLK